MHTSSYPSVNGQTSRRQFLQRALLGAAGIWIAGQAPLMAARRKVSPNEKLNLGIIGVGNQGRWNLDNIAGENIVAICDVDENFLGAAAKRFPSAKTYNDFRKLVDQDDIDAILVATPDHTHAVATMAVLKSGRPVYCEKPLTHTLSECRMIRNAAKKAKVPTQLGTQIHADANYRRVVELVQAGAIGAIKDVHVWVGANYGGKEWPKETPPVPANLHWDLWLGPVEETPYSPEFAPFNWRNWWRFGGGSMADFGCHFMDLPHWALDLREALSAEPVDGPPLHAHSTPTWAILRFQYPARKEKPPVTLTWYHGGKKPKLLDEIIDAEQRQQWGAGVLFIGEKGMILSGYHRHMLLPEDKFKDFQRPQATIPNSIGHHKEWIRACKTGEPTTCNFDYSGALTESVLLGNVAYRAQTKVEWDAKAGRIKNPSKAEVFAVHQYRKGWKL